MSRTRFQRAVEIFQRLCDLPRSQWTDALDRECGDDPHLRRDVEEMLEVDSDHDHPLVDAHRGLSELARSAIEGRSSSVPSKVDRFEILDELGRGGMGVVYRARQDHPEREVALKLLRGADLDEGSLRRFEFETQVLARLRHPGIAPLYDAGMADIEGERRPYFVMELVEGQPLTDDARTRGLGVVDRLARLLRVCEAVQYAHQQGVVHRDLKPANLLAEPDGGVKVLDFGIARTIDSDTDATRRTDAGRLLGTLAYMSPEQVSGDPLRIDVRTDVYALGVVAYELLSERLPHSVSAERLADSIRQIAEDDPPRLGTIDRSLRGDLETIVAKALDRNPDRRYPTVHAFAADVGRFLANEPIEARPASAAYQVRKFAQRHRGLVAGLSVAFTVLVIAVVALAMTTRRAQSAEQDAATLADEESRLRVEAQHREEIAQSIRTVLEQILRSAAPVYAEIPADYDPPVSEILGRATERFEGEFDGPKEVEASVRATLGQTWLDLGRHQEATVQLRRSLALNEEIHGREDHRSLLVLRELVQALNRTVITDEAIALAEQSVDLHRRVYGADEGRTLQAILDLALAYGQVGDVAGAVEQCREAYELALDALGEDDETTLKAQTDWGQNLLLQGSVEEAVDVLREASDIQVFYRGEEHLRTLQTQGVLARALTMIGEDGEARDLLDHVYEVYLRVFGPDHHLTLTIQSPRIAIVRRSGNVEEALRMRRSQVETAIEAQGATHAFTLHWTTLFARDLMRAGRFVEAEARARAAVEGMRETLLPENVARVEAEQQLGQCLLRLQRASEAEPILQEVLRIGLETLPEGHWKIGDYLADLGACEVMLGRYEVAEERLRAADAILFPSEQDPSRRMKAAQLLISMYESLGRHDEARQLRARIARDG